MLQENSHDWAVLLGISPATMPPIPAVHESASLIVAIDKSTTDAPALADQEFNLLVPFLPPEPKQGFALSNRQVLNALLWAAATGRPLTNLPHSYGTHGSVRKRCERWALLGVGEKLLHAIDGLPLGHTVKAIIKPCAASLERRRVRIEKLRASLR